MCRNCLSGIRGVWSNRPFCALDYDTGEGFARSGDLFCGGGIGAGLAFSACGIDWRGRGLSACPRGPARLTQVGGGLSARH